MNKKVIYTCLTGKYDKLQQPTYVDPTFDYICFSNDSNNKKLGVWEVRPLPFLHKDKTRESRYVKLNPHLVLSEYTYSIWIDANIQVVGNVMYRRISELIQQHVLVAQLKHPFADCIYEDLYNCVKCARDKISILQKHYNFLKQEKYPEHIGLYENGLIFRQHNNPYVVRMSEYWWTLYLEYSRRDQLTLCYVYWKLNFKPEYFFLGDIRSLPGFKYHYHQYSFYSVLIQKIKCRRNRILLVLLKLIGYM